MSQSTFVMPRPEDQYQAQFDQFNLNILERKVATRLLKLHGHCTLHGKADRSVELRMADPELIETDGDKELISRHLYVNISKFVREGHHGAAHCVKTGRNWNVNELLQMLPIEQRVYAPKPLPRKLDWIDLRKQQNLDEQGKVVPLDPGKVIPLNQIEDDGHPALLYLRERGFEAETLVEQFRAGYCEAINPDLRATRMPGGLCRPPEGRIVFYADVNGSQRGWQARRIDRRNGNQLLFWDAWKKSWLPVAEIEKDGVVTVYSRYDGTRIGRDQDMILGRKYLNAPLMPTSEIFLGLDAAIKWRHRTGKQTIGLVEGVFDAARLGPPFVSILGLTLKPAQADLLLGQGFSRVVYVCDRDEDSENAQRTRNSMQHLHSSFDVKELELPTGLKDAAEMTPEQVCELRSQAGID